MAAAAPLYLPPWFELKQSVSAASSTGAPIRGLYVKRPYWKKEKLGYFKGTIISEAEANRITDPARRAFLMPGLPGQVIDGSTKRNHMRWIVSSTEPNVKAYVHADKLTGNSKVVIRAIRYIKKGEEVTIAPIVGILVPPPSDHLVFSGETCKQCGRSMTFGELTELCAHCAGLDAERMLYGGDGE